MKSLFFALVFVLFASQAQATVGGPSYIGYFKYNSADQSVYYIHTSSDGRGCPPILQKLSLESEKIETVFSCEQGEILRGNDYGSPSAFNEIIKLAQNYKDLTPISLPRNNIEIDLNFVKADTIPEEDWITQSHFLATVYKDGKKIDEFPIEGCNQEQPFSFAGYAIPGFDKKIVLLSSTKSDCFEGGYTGEELHVIGGIDNLDKSHTGEYKSHQFPLTPSEDTLVVFEKGKNASNSAMATAIAVGVIALVIGLLIGRTSLARRK